MDRLCILLYSIFTFRIAVCASPCDDSSHNFSCFALLKHDPFTVSLTYLSKQQTWSYFVIFHSWVITTDG